MSITSYAELKSSIYTWLIRNTSDLVVTDAVVSNYIALTEAEINRTLKVRVLEETYDFDTVAAQKYVDLPADFGGIEALYFQSSPYNIEFEPSRQNLTELYNQGSGRPEAFTILGGRIYFNCPADAEHAMTLDYYKKAASLSDVTTTNEILANFPDLYLYGAQKHAGTHIKDQDVLSSAMTFFQSIIDQANTEHRDSKFMSGMRMRTRQNAAGSY